MSYRKLKIIFLLFCTIYSVWFVDVVNAQEDGKQLVRKRYSDPKGYFTIVIPEGWRIQEYPDNPRGKVAFIGKDANVELRILASEKEFSSFEDLFEITQQNTMDIKNRFGIDVTIQKTTFLGRQAIKRTWAMKGIKIFAIDFMEGNIRHALQYSAPSEVYERYLLIILKAIETYEPIPRGISSENLKKCQISNSLRLAQLFFEQGNFDLALEDLKKGLDIDPQNEQLLKLKKKIEEKTKTTNGETKSEANAHKERGATYTMEGKYDKAIEEFSKAISFDPNDAETYIGRGFIYRRKGQYDKAIEDFNIAVKLDPKATDAYMNRGHCYVDKGQNEKAIGDFSKTITLNPNLSEAYNNRGLAYRKSGNNKKAIEDYNKAIAIDPKNGEAYNNRGVLYINLGDVKKAIADFKKASELGSDRGRRNLERALQE